MVGTTEPPPYYTNLIQQNHSTANVFIITTTTALTLERTYVLCLLIKTVLESNFLFLLSVCRVIRCAVITQENAGGVMRTNRGLLTVLLWNNERASLQINGSDTWGNYAKLTSDTQLERWADNLKNYLLAVFF